ncbi:glycosyltransferase family 4 protein [Alsobacter sp. R-9]
MKISFAHDVSVLGYLVPDFPSQTHAFFWREVCALRQSGIDVRLISTTRPDAAASAHSFSDEARAQTRYLFPPGRAALVAAARHPAGLLEGWRYIAQLTEGGPKARVRHLGLMMCAAELVHFCEEAGIEHLHCHSCADAAHVVALANVLSGMPYSISVHGDLPVYGVDHFQKFRRASAVVPVTHPLKEQVDALHALPGEVVQVVTMGVDVDRFRPDVRAPASGAALHVVTVARLNETKGHVYLLEAVARLKARGHAVRASFAGEGPHRSAIEQKIASLDLADDVMLLGTVAEDEVLRLLRNADVFALTSFGQGEAAPVSVMEAMACGLPVICSRIGGTAQMIRHGVNGVLVNQMSVDDIDAALTSLLDPDRRLRLGTAARERAVTTFDYRATAAELLKVIANGRRHINSLSGAGRPC